MAKDLEFLQKLDHPEDGEYTRSLIDLIDVQTVDLELAAFFASHIWRGASYITGSGPGGIGKTTTMHALLSFVAADLPFVTALPGEVSSIGETKSCVIRRTSPHLRPAKGLVRPCAARRETRAKLSRFLSRNGREQGASSRRGTPSLFTVE